MSAHGGIWLPTIFYPVCWPVPARQGVRVDEHELEPGKVPGHAKRISSVCEVVLHQTAQYTRKRSGVFCMKLQPRRWKKLVRLDAVSCRTPEQGSRDSRLSLSGCIAKTNCGECCYQYFLRPHHRDTVSVGIPRQSHATHVHTYSAGPCHVCMAPDETLRKDPHPRLAGEYSVHQTAERQPLSTVQFDDEGSTN